MRVGGHIHRPGLKPIRDLRDYDAFTVAMQLPDGVRKLGRLPNTTQRLLLVLTHTSENTTYRD